MKQIIKKRKRETSLFLLKLFGQAKFVFGQVIILVTCPNGQVGKKVNVEPCYTAKDKLKWPRSDSRYTFM